MDKQEFWIIKLTKPDGEFGYSNFKFDITRSFKWVATWLSKGAAERELKHFLNCAHYQNAQVKRWLKDGAKTEVVKLIMQVEG